MERPGGRRFDQLSAVLRKVSIALVIATSVLWVGDARADRASARHLVERARTYRARGASDEALRLCERAIAQDADYLPAHEMAAPMWFDRGKYKTVIGHFERLTLRFPDYAFGWYTLAYAYRLDGQTHSAIAAYELYIGMRPDEAAPYFGLAMSYKKAGRTDDAGAAFRRYIELEGSSARAGFVQKARSELERLAGAGRPDIPARERPDSQERPDGHLFEQTDRPGPSHRAESVPGDPALLTRVRALIAEQRYASAEAALTRFHPGDWGEQKARALLLVQIFIGRGQSRSAGELLWATLAAVPWDPSVQRFLLALPTESRARTAPMPGDK
ncbi:MAG: tetratricopeptide repeat protein [Proteobacteria bacterium]|nr:tetratricopeptide repeat protein [Pseudomonadota bacterium]